MSYLIQENPLLLFPSLANTIGINEALLLQQVNYWMGKSKTGWVYNTYESWQKQFPFWSISTIRRTINNLEKAGYLKSRQEAGSFDRKKYYRVDYNKVDQNELSFSSILNQESPLIVLPGLALAIGLKEAILLHQVHYWVERSIDGWVYNTYEEWQKQFRILSVKTVTRIIRDLERAGYLISRQDASMDRKKFYSIDYLNVAEIQELQNLSCVIPRVQIASPQNTQVDTSQDTQDDLMRQYQVEPMLITENTTEITSEIKGHGSSFQDEPCNAPQKKFRAISVEPELLVLPNVKEFKSHENSNVKEFKNSDNRGGSS